MLHRLLPFLVLLILISFGLFQITPVKREIVYKLGISGDTTTSCCNESEVISSTGEFDENASLAIFNGEVINYPKTSLAYEPSSHLRGGVENPSDSHLGGGPGVLGTTNAAGEEKWIEVSLAEQKVRAWEGNRQIMEFPVSSGKWAPTPTGDFRIWYKTKRQSMIGGRKEWGTYYNLPNVPHNMFFYKGYALHGAYWHNNFGNPMSHGCVNEPLANAAEIFAWAGPVIPEGQNVVRASPEKPGTRVFVH
ncbi:MAG: ErfK/YbiS/YcfS/YnhG family protein [Microgenomates group bacterium Gr01-1014_80]|nr:MAG: ErfK/YbiS/YcfS/YnhG family protein [Microgenomates group bacterium Gr01-1014_80]